jgi:hypothetical protein
VADHPDTLTCWLVTSGQEAAFVAAWQDLAVFFLSVKAGAGPDSMQTTSGHSSAGHRSVNDNPAPRASEFWRIPRRPLPDAPSRFGNSEDLHVRDRGDRVRVGFWVWTIHPQMIQGWSTQSTQRLVQGRAYHAVHRYRFCG